MAIPSDPASCRCFNFNCSDLSDLSDLSDSSDTAVSSIENTFIAAGAPQREVVFVDASLYLAVAQVSQVQLTARHEPTSTREFVMLELDRNGMYQISDALVDRTDITDLHLVVPGVPAQFRLGSAMLNLDTIDFYQYEFPIWDDALTADAEVWIHCDTAAAGTPPEAATALWLGQGLMQRLSQLTQRRVCWSNRMF